MTELIGGAVWASVAGTVIAALLATIVGTFIRWKRPAASTRCTLWLIVLSTCLLAPATILGAMNLPSARSFAHAHGAINAQARAARIDFGQAGRVRGNAFAPRTLLQRPSLPGHIAIAIAVLWVGGALVGCFGLLRSVARVRALKRRSSPLDGSLPDDLPWLTQRPGREIYLRLSYEIETPIAIGFRRPVILIPTEMATLAGLCAIESLVMHEHAHLARYDDWTNLWQRVVERLTWWNPLVWYVGRRLGLEREVAADDAVVRRTQDAPQYARALWRLAREMRMPEHVVVAPGAMMTRKQISIRIERLLDDSAKPHPYFGAGIAVATIAACTVAAVAASAPRFTFTRFEAHTSNAQLLLPSTQRSVTRARAFAALVRVRPLAIDGSTSSSIFRFSHQAAEHAAIARATTPAVAMHISQAVARAQPVKAASAAPDDVRGETLGPYHTGCMGCDLQNADLHGQDFRRAYFQGANMENADLHGANFRNAVLIGVNLENADLDGADLRGAQLTGTNLQGASMRRTLTTGMSLTGTSLP